MIKNLLFIIACSLTIILTAQNKNLSNGFVFDGEPYITVNPNNSQHLVVAWMGWKLNNLIVIKTRTSFDAGQTWSTTTSIPHITAGNQSADPSLSFDNAGNLFLCFIDFTPLPAAGAVYVVKSTDGGLNWGTPVEVINVNSDGSQQPVDRPWMSIDNSNGTYDGTIYVTTMNPSVFGPVTAPYNPYFIRSIDGGNTFEPWKYLDTTGWLAGNVIPQPMPTNCVSSNGTFHAIYPSWYTPQSFLGQYISTSSSDAGNSFNYSSVMSVSTGNTDTLPKKGYHLIANPANPNHLLFAYPNYDNGDIDVYTTESLDAGSTWSTPIRINDDPIANKRMQDLIWADFDVDGDVIITWRDRRNASDSTYTVSSEIYAAVRSKDSTNFSPNFVLSDSSVSYNSVLANSGNDFMCVNMINDTVYAVWGDTRNGYLNIWFQQSDLSSGLNAIVDLANDITPINIFPNPAKNTININLGDNDLQNSSIQIINTFGEIILTQPIMKQQNTFNLSRYPNGNYFIKFTNLNGSISLKVIKE